MIPAAVVSGILFQVCKAGFVLYFERVSNLEAVYGSLTSVIVVLIWLYLSARVLLFGADLIWALERPPSQAPFGPSIDEA